jgi:hypothetical protein
MLLARSAPFLAIAAAVLLAGAVGLIGLRQKPPLARQAPESGATVAPAAVLAAEPALPSPSRPAMLAESPAAAPPAAPSSLDERSLMTTLRELRGSNPTLTLQLAREGNRRFPDSPDVAERSWVIVKSLSDLGRHDEARVEGRILVERYRDTRWGEDVYRHLFVNPPTHPFERGYGKELEGE